VSTDQTPVNDLAQVFPKSKTIIINSADFIVAPFKVGRLPDVLAAVQPVTHMLLKLKSDSEAKDNADKKLDVSSMMMLYADDCLNLIAAMSGKGRQWVDDLNIDDACKLFGAQLEVNLDFLVNCVLPELMGALENLTFLAKTNGSVAGIIGRIASNLSSPTDTTSTTS